MKVNIFNLNLSEIEKFIKEKKYPRYRAEQIYHWLYKSLVYEPKQMLNLPEELKKKLDEFFVFQLPVIKDMQISKIDNTTKYLLELKDKQLIEVVLMFHQKDEATQRKTICISSQVGCPIGCSFCATGQMGFTRNLDVAEIIGQVLLIIKKHGNIDNIVFMGMGEPLLNYDNVVKSIKIFIDEKGLNFSRRKITISTCGLIPEIRKLALENLSLTLAISLHSADDKLRNRLVPINKKYPIEELIDVVRYYIDKTNRKVTFEYVLIRGINDFEADAYKLAKKLKRIICNVNVIPANQIKNQYYQKPESSNINKFVSILRNEGIEVAIRSEKGSDIDAACGQLKTKALKDIKRG